MAGRRAIQGVLHSFLGTYTSRNSDFDGYWLFGFLPTTLQEWHVDLLATDHGEAPSAPQDVARGLARAKFREQMRKNGVALADIQSAFLGIRGGMESKREVDGQEREGRSLRFEARAMTSRGGECSDVISVFVAPHDPRVERRSARAVDGRERNRSASG